MKKGEREEKNEGREELCKILQRCCCSSPILSTIPMCLPGGGACKKTLSQEFAKVRVSFVWMVPYKIQLQMKYNIGSY